MRLTGLIVTLLVGGCSFDAIQNGDLWVRGGSASGRIQATLVHRDFVEHIAPRTVAVSEISFASDVEAWGTWNRADRRIQIDDGLNASQVGWAVRRQLCRAVADDLVAEGALGPEYLHPLVTDGVVTEDACLECDVFAKLCGVGPYGAYLLDGWTESVCGAPASDSADALADVFRHLSAEVWTGYERPPLAGPTTRVGGFDTGYPLRLLHVNRHAADNGFAAQWSPPTGFARSVLLDAFTGGIVEEFAPYETPDTPSLPIDIPVPDHPLIEEFVPIQGHANAVVGWATVWLPDPWWTYQVPLLGDADGLVKAGETGCGAEWGAPAPFFTVGEQLMQAVLRDDGFDWHVLGRVGDAP